MSDNNPFSRTRRVLDMPANGFRGMVPVLVLAIVTVTLGLWGYSRIEGPQGRKRAFAAAGGGGLRNRRAGARGMLTATVALLAALSLVAPGLAQRADRIPINDPTDALGDDRAEIAEAAAELAQGGQGLQPHLAITVIPALDGRDAEEVAAQRFRVAAKASKANTMLLLALEERRAVFALPNSDALEKLGPAVRSVTTQPMRAASQAGTQAFESGDAGAAALAGLEALAEELGGGDGGGHDDAPTWLTILLPVFLVLGTVNLVRGVRSRRLLRGFAGGITAVRNLEPGTAMVSGIAVADEPIAAPASGTPCVYWELSVQEQWRGTRTERRRYVEDMYGNRYPEDGGPPGGRLVEYEEEVETGTGVKDHGTRSRAIPFRLDDGTGQVLVLPERADVAPSPGTSSTVDRSDPVYQALGIREHHQSLGVRRLQEAVIEAGSPVTVVGPVEVQDGQSQIRWTRRLGPSGKHPFLITTEEPASAQRGERRRMIRRFAIAVACLVGTIVVLAMTA